MILVFRETDGITGDRLTFGEAPIDDGQVLIRSGRYITGSAVGSMHDPVTVVDSASINFTLVGQQLTGEVLLAGITHNLLSAVHPDTVVDNVIRGDIIVGNKTPLWERLPIGADGTFLRSNGTDAGWDTIQDTDFVHNLLSLTHHGDTIPQAVTRGALVVGIASPEPSTTTTTVSPSNLFWSRLDIGTEGMVLCAGLEDVEWGYIVPENLGVIGTDGTIAKFGATGIEDSIITEAGAAITIAGNTTISSGDLYLDDATDPSLYLRENGDAANYSRIYDASDNYLHICKVVATDFSVIYVDPMPGDGTSDAFIRLFRNTDTSGSRKLRIYKGDNTGTCTAEINAATGDLQLDGNLELEGDIGIAADTNLLQLAANALTINGTLGCGAITSTGAISDGAASTFTTGTTIGTLTLANGSITDSSGCLLYTSPSPRDRTRSRMPSSA